MLPHLVGTDCQTGCQSHWKTFRNKGHGYRDAVDDECGHVDPFWMFLSQPGAPKGLDISCGFLPSGMSESLLCRLTKVQEPLLS